MRVLHGRSILCAAAVGLLCAGPALGGLPHRVPGGAARSGKPSPVRVDPSTILVGLADGVHVVPVERHETVAHALAEVSGRPGVFFAEPNAIVRAAGLDPPDDPSYAAQWALAQIHALAGWSLVPGSYTPAPTPTIAIVDTGIDSTHEDLAAGIDTADAATCLNIVDTCIHGRALDNDPVGHGTHVAGIAGALADNATGIAGVAFASPLMPVKVLHGDESGTVAAVASGIAWAAAHGARVINLSLSTSAFSQTLCDAVAAATAQGSLVVAAAGNAVSGFGTTAPNYPAACPGAVGVTMTDRSDGSPVISNIGFPNAFVSAPGVDIVSTLSFGAYGSLTGTSASTAIVSGLAALLFAQHPDRTPADVRRVLARTSAKVGGVTYGPDPFHACASCTWHPWFGFGRVDALAALTGPAPVVTAVTPATGSVGTPVTLDGEDLTAATTVDFGGVPSPFTLVSETRITTTVPPGALAGKVRVTTPNGSSSASFAATPAVSPSHGRGGAAVMISGPAVGDATAVKIGSVEVGVAALSPTVLVARTGDDVTGGPVTVTTPEGSYVSGSSFVVDPTVRSFEPDSGPAATVVTVHGKAFGTAHVVTLGGVASVFTVLDPRTIQVTVPDAAVTGPISVTTAAGGVGTSPQSFVVTSAVKSWYEIGRGRMRGRRRFIAAVATALAGATLTAGGAAPVRASIDPAQNWEGVHDTAHARANAAGAVGPSSYLEVADAKFGIYDRTGGTVVEGNLGDLLPAPPATGHGGVLTQPQVLWDPVTNRFYYSFLDLDPPPFAGDGTNYVAFGFSTTSNPQGAGDFCKYELDFGGYKPVSPPLPSGDAFVPDRLRMGDTPGFVLFGVDVIDWNLTGTSPPTTGYFGSDVDWVKKPPAGASCPTAGAVDATTDNKIGIQDASGHAMRSPVPAVQVDGTPGWVVASRPPATATASQLSLIQVTEKSGLPSFAATVAITVPSYAAPPLAAEPGGSLDTGDGELGNAVAAIDPARGATAQALWTQHTVANGARSQVRWYELNPAAKTVNQSGSASDPQLSVFDGAIAPDRRSSAGAGTYGSDMALGFTTSSSIANPAFQWISKEGTGVQTAFNPLKQSPDPASGLGCEDPGDGVVCPWSAYAGASSDPAANAAAGTGQVWLTNAWTSGTGDANTPNWRTQNAAIKVPLSPGSITSIAPLAGPIGTKVTITGSHFLGPPTVQIGGISLTSLVVTATKITGTIPSGATSGQIAITNEGGTTLTAKFNVTPTIATFTPSGGRIGDPVTVTGTNLDEETAFKIGTVPVDDYAAQTSTHATFHVPVGAATGKLAITTAAGTFTTAASFQVRPTIGTPFVPDHGVVGTVVTIPGSSFTGVNSVKFSGFAGGAPSVAAVISFKSGVLKATVPKAAVSGPISVTTVTGGTTVSAASFVVDPAVTSLSPAAGPVASTLTVNGSGLDPSTIVTFSGYAGPVDSAAPLAGSTANLLKVAVPDGAKSGPVTVHTTASAVQPGGTFNVSPRITGIASTVPGPILAGGGVTVSGSNFDAPFTVKLGTTPINPDTTAPPSSFTFTVPAGAVTSTLTVTTPSGTASALLGIAPQISGPPSPTRGAAGVSVTILGSALTGVTGVKFTGPGGVNTVAGTITPITGGVKTVVPAGATTGPITVTTTGGSAATASFTVLPRMASFAPLSGPAGAAQVVTINGSGFQPNATVSFSGGVAAAVLTASPTKLTVKVPMGATKGKVTVANPTDSTSATSAGDFTVTFSVTSFSPSSGGPADLVSITGVGFTSSSKVFFGGDGTAAGTHEATVDAPSRTSTKLNAFVPAGDVSGRIAVKNGSSVTWSQDAFSSVFLDEPSPTSGPTGTVVTITGVGLTPGSTVKFAATEVPGAVVTPTLVTLTIPDGAVPNQFAVPGQGQISVAGREAASEFTVTFGVSDVTADEPASGEAKPGDHVTIHGVGFGTSDEPAVTGVSFGGVPATTFSVTGDPATIDAVVPDNAVTGKVTVSAGPTTVRSGPEFTIDGPHITGISPTQGITGTQVTVSGSGFDSSDTFKFNGQAVTPDGSVDPDKVKFTVPDGAVPGGDHSGVVSIGDPLNMTHPATTTFRVTLGISTLGSSNEPPGGIFAIGGAGFADASHPVTGVTVGSSSSVTFPAGFDPIDTEYFIAAPADATDGKVKVTTDQGTVTSVASFTVTRITGFTPTSGPPGTPVTISGVGFPGSPDVYFTSNKRDGIPATRDSSTQITAHVPDNATTGPIEVRHAGGAAVSADTFTVTALYLGPH